MLKNIGIQIALLFSVSIFTASSLQAAEWKLTTKVNKESQKLISVKWESQGKSLDAISPDFLKSLRRSAQIVRGEGLNYAVVKLPPRSLPKLIYGDQILLKAGEMVTPKGLGFICDADSLGKKGYFCNRESGNRYEFYFYHLAKQDSGEQLELLRVENAAAIANGGIKYLMTPNGVVIQNGDRIVTILPGGLKLRGQYLFSSLTKSDIDVIEGQYGGQDLVEALRQGTISLDSDSSEVKDRMLEVLTSKKQRNPLLTGLPGTAFDQGAYQLAQLIADDKVPELSGWKIYQMDWSEFNANGNVDEAVSKIKDVMSAARLKKVILFFPDIDNLIGLGIDGRDAGQDVSSAMLTDLKLGRVIVFGTSSIENIGVLRQASQFYRNFNEITVPSPKGEALLSLVEKNAAKALKEYKVIFEKKLLQRIIHQTELHLPDLAQPQKSIDAINFLAKNYGPTNPDDDDTVPVVMNKRMFRKWLAKTARIPGLDPSDELKAFLKKDKFLPALEDFIVGHEKSKEAVHKAMLNVLSDTSFNVGGNGSETGVQLLFFTGPSGVGKSMSPQVLSRMLREKLEIEWVVKAWEGQQWTDKGDVNIVFGAPPGFVGHNPAGGPIYQHVKNFPQSIMVFEEMDKMHRAIHNALYKVFDDGIVNDKSTGKEARFTRGLIFLTSNFGSIPNSSFKIPTDANADKKDGEVEVSTSKGSDIVDDWDRWHIFGQEPRNPKVKDMDEEALKQALINELTDKKAMSPQMVGRIGKDNIVIFHHFRKKEIKEIGKRQLARLQQNIDENLSVKLVFDKDLLDWATKRAWGIDGANAFHTGARSILNVVKNQIVSVVNEAAIDLDSERTNIETWVLSVKDDKVVVTKK